jgi:hypothetical protein
MKTVINLIPHLIYFKHIKPLKIHNLKSITPKIIVYVVYMFGVMLIFPYILCLFVLWRVEETVTEDPGEQQVEVAEQELIEGKLCL